MKKYFAALLASCLLFVCSSAWADYWNEGHAGTEADPYVIDSVEDLVALRDRVNDATESGDMYYKLTQNLNISQNLYWVSIGDSQYRPFTGHFDGNGKQIYVNLRRGDAGVFHFVNTKADTYAVKNLIVSGTFNGNWAAGIVVELFSGIVDNCSATGTLTGSRELGGIVGIMHDGKITNCTVNATITGGDNGGGIVGYVTGGSIESCKVEGTNLSNFENGGVS